MPRLRKEQIVGAGGAASSIAGFVELSVQDEVQTKLERASLVFSSFSIAIEGELKTSKLIEILRILEDPRC